MQIVNCLCVPVIIYAGNQVLAEISSEPDVRLSYDILMLCCFPLIFYTSFVYGEIISAAAGMLFFHAALRYLKWGKHSAWLVMIACSVIGNASRGNFVILLTAFAIMAFLYAIRRKKWIYLLCAASLFVSVKGFDVVNTLYYERISGVEIRQGMPVECLIAMGLNEYSEIGYGWYNGQSVMLYADSGYDRQAARDAASHYIRDRLRMFRNRAGVSPKDFYKQKLLSQWNDPTLYYFIENRIFYPNAAKWVKEIVEQEGKYTGAARALMNQYQMLLYLGALFYAFSLFRKKASFYPFLIVLTLMGGFCFTMLWESMSRYIFPYVVYMVPLAAMGWQSAAGFLAGCKNYLKNR